ncbi:HlyD family type I secretion periplasmic adaptor subunit [Acidocella sp. KAb 2-4]|uniref:HlyD family type I secretion periplasmic adaptor subunit n=1 Tax=Acidocella sp. KAb 2-4 TaxID=2885158 RepID=UPI001D061803|nr:HlyD family type I secretion periplasmic adaptor subunit [Acidocella sp. KAb 2-4]MCB5944857.1 HlyD family type I secretion periplasmic adaptor subunit [Acidocella sp. KAb 2-4]
MLRLRQLLPKATEQAAAEPEGLPLAVLEFQSPTAAVIATPLPMVARSTTYILGALVLVLFVVSGVFKVDRLVVGTGTLNATQPDSSIQTFNTASIIREIKVHAGDFVAKGQVLATLDPTYASADLTGLTQQEQNYAAQVAQLQAQEDGKPYVPDPSNPYSSLQLQTYNQQMGQYNFTLQNYDQQIAQLKTEIQGYQAQAADYRQRLAIASNVEHMRKKLQQLQVGSQLETLAATDDRVSMQTQLSSAVSQAQADERQLAAVQAQRDSFDQQFKAQTSTQLATALNNLAQAQQQLAKAKLNKDLVELTAPQDSVVQSIAQVSNGSVLQPGQQLMDLAPVNTPFSIEADIDATESGYVQVGDQVVIKFATLNSMLYGTAKGTVTSISAESFNPQDQQQAAVNGPPLPGAPQNLYYKAQISLDVLNLHNVPKGFRLVPGMPVEADIVVGKRSILGYFLSRMAPVAYNSLHEP